MNFAEKSFMKIPGSDDRCFDKRELAKWWDGSDDEDPEALECTGESVGVVQIPSTFPTIPERASTLTDELLLQLKKAMYLFLSVVPVWSLTPL
jgi:hypothetical protein